MPFDWQSLSNMMTWTWMDNCSRFIWDEVSYAYAKFNGSLANLQFVMGNGWAFALHCTD